MIKGQLNCKKFSIPLESDIMGKVVFWETACNFNAVILNQSIFNCLITSVPTLLLPYHCRVSHIGSSILLDCSYPFHE